MSKNDKRGREGASESLGRTTGTPPQVVRGNAAPAETSEPPPEPPGLCEAGRRLWQSVTTDYELEEHERLLLEQAARAADIVAALDAAVPAGGTLIADGRVRPEVVEARQQRIVLARLLAALRVPLGDVEHDTGHGPPRLQKRAGARGVYSLGSAS